MINGLACLPSYAASQKDGRKSFLVHHVTMKHLAQLLAHKQSIVGIALLGVLLNVLGLSAPAFTDDFVQWAVFTRSIDHVAHPGTLFGLFDLVDGSAAQLQSMKDAGRLLWSASDSLHLSFWRPVSELTHWVDDVLWRDSPTLMRVHSLLWYGALLALLGRFYRMLDTSRVRSGLAMALFATSSLHFFVVMWISARNQIIAACFCVLTLMAYHTWRRSGLVRYGLLGGLTLVLSLLSAEAGVATGGYLLAYALCYEQGPLWRQRLWRLAPFFMLIAAWRITHVALGFGSASSGSYVDPGVSARFIHALLQRLPALMFSVVTGISSGLQATMSDTKAWMFAAAAVIILSVLAKLAARAGLWSRREFRFYALGALFALIPVCAVSPTDRVLLNAEIGMSAVLAALFSQWLSQLHREEGRSAIPVKTALGLLVAVHAVAFPVATLFLPLITDKVLARYSVNEALTLPDEVAKRGSQVILVNPPGPFMLFYYPLIRSYFGKPNPEAIQAMATGVNQALRLTVLDDRTIELESHTSFVQPIMRDVIAQPFKVGDVAKMGDVTVTITNVSGNGEPLGALFKFPVSIHDPRWQFFVWHEPHYERMTMPPVGQTMYLANLDVSQATRERLRRAFSTAN